MGATWHWSDLTFIKPSVVKLDYGKVSVSDISSFITSCLNRSVSPNWYPSRHCFFLCGFLFFVWVVFGCVCVLCCVVFASGSFCFGF